MYSQMFTLLGLLCYLFSTSTATYPAYGMSTRINPSFIPSKSGETPSCVSDPRLTYCIKPKKYPKERILYLLKNKMFDVDTFLQDETRDTYTFEARDGMIIPSTMMYPPRMPMGYQTTTSDTYRSPKPTADGYLPPRQNVSNLYNQRAASRRNKRQAATQRDLCPSRSNYIMPRAAQSVGGDWMFLVNVDEQYTQLVKSETCIQNTCQGSCDAPDGFTAICQQQYVQKRLVALDGSGSKLNSDTFWFPSCCLCKIRPS